MSYSFMVGRVIDLETGYTYNINKMVYAAVGESLSDLNGLPIEDVKYKLKKLLSTLKNNPEKYKQYNPDNGWGNYDDFLEFLGRIIDDIEIYDGEGYYFIVR